MPLVPATFKTELRTLMLADPAIGAVDGPALTALVNAIVTACDHYIRTATVTSTGTAPPGGGVVPSVGVIT
jgi:hypothetical protein